MAEARCDCCDLPEYSCGRTVERRQREQAEQARKRMFARGAVEAAFYGFCAGCQEYFPVGALILPARAGGGWVAECCA